MKICRADPPGRRIPAPCARSLRFPHGERIPAPREGLRNGGGFSFFVPFVTRGQGVVAVSAVGSPAFTGPLLDPPHNPQHPKNTSFPRILERDGRRCRPLRHLHRAASSGRLPGRLCLKNSLTADSSSFVGLFYLLSPSAVAFGIVNTRP